MAVGARSCVFAPFDNVSLFIIDEEQEDTYKSDDLAPRYLAHEVCVMRAKMNGAIVIYGSTTPISVHIIGRQREMCICSLLNKERRMCLCSLN